MGFFEQDGTTPLMFSVARGHFECVQELLEQGADPNARRFEVNIKSQEFLKKKIASFRDPSIILLWCNECKSEL